MKELSRLAKNVNPSTTLAIDAMAKQMRADGLDVIGFGAGEPDFETPVNIQDAAIDAIRKGKTKYTPAAGIVELRKAAAARLKADCGVDYDYTQIVIASGAKHNVYIALATLINPGDEIIVPAPYWVSYCEMVSMLGGTPVPVLADEAQHFKITAAQLEAAITDKTKAVMLNNPCNPTGMFYTKSELEALAEVCVKHDLYVIADEIYYQLQRMMGVLGPCLSPFSSFLISRGLQTLPIRMEKHCDNAERLVEYLDTKPFVKQLIYPGLERHPGHELAGRQLKRYGGMLCFLLDTDHDTLFNEFLPELKLFKHWVSLGEAHSLISPKAEDKEKGIPADLIRVSAGLECADDLIADLERGFKKIFG